MTLTPKQIQDTISRLTSRGGAFEVTPREVGGGTYRVFANAISTLVELLQAGRGHGDADFLVYGEQRWSFDRFYADADALAAHLQLDLGVRPGDRVAIAMRNCPDWLIVSVAAAQIGAVVVPINSLGSAAELKFTLDDCGAAVLAADLPRARFALPQLAQAGIPLLFSEIDGYAADLADASAERLQMRRICDVAAENQGRKFDLAAPRPEDVALLMYTSGSSGTPKGVIYRHLAIGQAVMNMFFAGFLAIELGGGIAELRGGATAEVQLVTVPLFHATGLFSGFLLPSIIGQKVVLLPKWDPASAMKAIQAERVTMVSTVPAILKDLLTDPRIKEYDLSSVSRVASAGAATPADLPDLLEEKLGIVSRSAGYGLTETAAVCATMSGPVFDLQPLACGVLSPIIELRTANAEGAVLPPTTEGEIQLRGATVTPGYWLHEDLNKQAFTDDGWFHTGDLGHVDADGFLHITGRIKEIVIRGGENISPAEIENVAYRHPGVKEVAVFGVPDDAMGEELAMVCHPQPEAALGEDELRNHLRAALPKYKVPRYITLSDAPLPRNASEKIHRLALRKCFVTP